RFFKNYAFLSRLPGRLFFCRNLKKWNSKGAKSAKEKKQQLKIPLPHSSASFASLRFIPLFSPAICCDFPAISHLSLERRRIAMCNNEHVHRAKHHESFKSGCPAH